MDDAKEVRHKMGRFCDECQKESDRQRRKKDKGKENDRRKLIQVSVRTTDKMATEIEKGLKSACSIYLINKNPPTVNTPKSFHSM